MKNIGFVSYWFNRGQAVVTKYIKSVFDEAGYNTHVLVRRGKLASTTGDWKDSNITIGSQAYDMNVSTYTKWAKQNNLDVCIFAQNYQFDAIKAVRDLGIKTAGWFVWEQFDIKDAKPAKKALDQILSLTKADFNRYQNKMDIGAFPIRWGIHPSLLSYDIKEKDSDIIWFYYPAGYCNERKAIKSTIDAFCKVKNKNIRLLITSQKDINTNGDPRIKLIVGNVEKHKDFHRQMLKCDVCLIPSKWEGLGLSFMEAIAFKMPIITTDFPPMNEYVVDNKTGFLAQCATNKRLENGLKIAEVDVDYLANKIKQLSDRELVSKMSKQAEQQIQKFSWDKTKEDLLGLLEILK